MHATAVDRASAVVAVEVSALRGGSRPEASFLEFVLGVLADDDAMAALPWTLERAGRASGTARLPRRRAAAVAAPLISAAGLAPRSRWVAPRADVVHLASGPLAIELDAPGIVTVHRVDAALRAPSSRADRRRREALRRAADAGVVLHAVTDAVADELVGAVGIDATCIIVANPGIDVRSEAATVGIPPVDVDVVADTSSALGAEVVRSIRATGAATARLAEPRGVLAATCVVVVSPDEGFPAAALEAMAQGRPVVTRRNPTTGALLGGAARFVDDATAEEFTDAAVGLVASEQERAICVTAGRARASDFDARRRAADLAALYARARLAR